MSSDTHRAYIKAKMHCSWSLWAFRCIIVNYKNYKFLLLNWHKYTTCDSWLHLLAGFVFMSKRIFWCLATVSGTHSCKHHIIDINVMSILRHSVASPAITPWGSELGWTLTFAPAQASGGQTEGPQGPRGQHSILSSRWRWRSESRVHGSCFSRLGVLSHPEIYQSRSLVKLKAKKWGSTLLFFSGRNCKVRERGHWRAWNIGAANSSAAVTHLHASCPPGAESQSFHGELVSARWWAAPCSTRGLLHLGHLAFADTCYPLSCSSSVSLPIFLWNSYKPKLFLDSFWDTCYDQNKLTGSLWEAWESSPVHHDFTTTVRVCPNMHGSKLNLRGFILKTSSLLH